MHDQQSPLDTLWNVESGVIRWLQGAGDWLAVPLGGLTHLGSQGVFIVLAAVLFWCVNPSLGGRLIVVVIASGVLNNLLKSISYTPRPYWFDARITGYQHHASFGMPSGHSQAAMVVWGYLGIRSGRRALMWAAGVVILLVAFSRIYLGVHFISDVVVGLTLGALIVWATLRYEDRVLAWWRGLDTTRRLTYLSLAAVVPCALATTWQLGVRGAWVVPTTEWIGATPADPAGHSLAGLYTACGGLFGSVLGLTLLYGRGWYSAEGSVVARVARFALGISVVALIAAPTELLFGGLTGVTDGLVSFVVYGALAFWATYGAPRLFIASGLATTAQEAESADRR
ncbi:phosphatase PAP2 family protein [Nocardiopsis sp. MG754419]|uniref:phosphatase PAP2 family protein n=1 Tax=Nocardiopsis sp. MG754419 TaxID=2259865 RepID=UPI0027DD4714|nr:phosphatase PAP2 family protein [Nocardiopsis sp. MG754419]